MISDTLHDAAEDIRRTLADPVMGGAYDSPMRERINALLAEMDAIRRDLDTPPAEAEPT
jgi:hypothetical protein